MTAAKAIQRRFMRGLLWGDRPRRRQALAFAAVGSRETVKSMWVSSAAWRSCGAGRHDNNAAGGQVVALPGDVDGEASAQHVDEHGTVRTVLAQLGPGIEDKKCQRRLGVAVQRFLAVAAGRAGRLACQFRGGRVEVERLRGRGEALVGVRSGAVRVRRKG